MAEAERPDDNLDQIRLARLERRHFGTERTDQGSINPAPLSQREEVDANLLVLEIFRVDLGDPGFFEDRRQSRVGGREEVVVDLPPAFAVEIPGAEVARGDEVHVAVDALPLRDRRVIEAPGPVSRDAGE